MRFVVIIGFICWMLGASLYWVCVVRQDCTSKQANGFEEGSGIATPLLGLQYKGESRIQSTETFHFARSDSFAYLPTSVKQFVDSLGRLLFYHPYLDVEITGHFTLEEVNSSSYSNIGIARAAFVANLIQQHNIEPERFYLSYRLRMPGRLFDLSDTLKGGIDFQLFENPIPGDPLLPNPDEATFFSDPGDLALFTNPPTLYISTSDSLLIIDDEIRQFCSLCTQYMKAFPEKTLLLTGYAENQASAQIETQTGLTLAALARRRLGEFGMPLSRINIRSRGAEDPIASNSSDLGRQKNRRVELSIR